MEPTWVELVLLHFAGLADWCGGFGRWHSSLGIRTGGKKIRQQINEEGYNSMILGGCGIGLFCDKKEKKQGSCLVGQVLGQAVEE